jgi:hypothetical protein
MYSRWEHYYPGYNPLEKRFEPEVKVSSPALFYPDKVLNNQGLFFSIGKENQMKQYPLVGVSIIAVVILSLALLSNVVGYQSVLTSHQQTLSEAATQRELLFQTIIDIANNKEIQRIILKSPMSRGIFPVSDIPILTKNQLKQMYFIGLIFSKFITISRIHSMIQKHQLIFPGKQQEINTVIQKDSTLKQETMQLTTLKCDCENKNITVSWHFPIICWLLVPFMAIALFLMFATHIDIVTYLGLLIGAITYAIMAILQCQYPSLKEGNQ